MKILNEQIYQKKFHTCDEFVRNEDISSRESEELDASM